MKRYIQHGHLTVSHFVSRQWEHPVHNHNHFEIIFIHRGKGSHTVSGSTYRYEGLGLFLLAPCDYHSFAIEEESEFTFLKFTNTYLRDIAPLMVHARQHNGPLVQHDGKMDGLVRLIVQEWTETRNEGNETLSLLMQALISMIRRQLLPGRVQQPSRHAATITHLLNYLHANIHSSEQTQLQQLASHFNYSKNYLGIFFKEQTGVTLRDYVNRYKLQLIEQQLQHSSLSLKEISNEFGFTDLSHFNKFFKGLKGMSPSVYREQLKQ